MHIHEDSNYHFISMVLELHIACICSHGF